MSTKTLFAVLASSLAGAALAGQPSNPNDEQCSTEFAVTLSGVLETHKEYGPPGWGEDPANDSRWAIVVINVSPTTAKKIGSLLKGCVNDNAEFTQVQLWFDQWPKDMAKYRGNKVRVAGFLTAASGAPAEIREAQVSVKEISLAQ